MSIDFKDGIQVEAEELADAVYGKEFYALTDNQQYEIYTRAERQYWENLYANADSLRKEQR